MRIKLINKADLSGAELRKITNRLFAEEHRLDVSPSNIWPLQSFVGYLFVITLIDSNEPIGIVFLGFPDQGVGATWWVDSLYRHQGYGSEAMTLLAELLKADEFNEPLVIATGEEGIASLKLVEKLFKQLSKGENDQ